MQNFSKIATKILQGEYMPKEKLEDNNPAPPNPYATDEEEAALAALEQEIAQSEESLESDFAERKRFKQVARQSKQYYHFNAAARGRGFMRLFTQ